MRFLKEFVILCACLFIGSILRYIIPLPIPETVYGMILLFILFLSKKLSPESVRFTSDGILDNMSFLFLPLGVGMIESMDLLKENIFSMIIISLISAIIAMIITMLIVSFIQKRTKDVQ